LNIFDLKTFIGTLPSFREKYDFLKLATALQGLANREKPRIYYLFENTRINKNHGVDIDRYWLEKLSAEGKLFAECEKIFDKYPPDFEGFCQLIQDFSGFFKGFVVWDENVPATANVASTASGAQNLLPVRYSEAPESLYYNLFFAPCARFAVSDIKLDLVGKFKNNEAGKICDLDIASTGSAKCDAYLWAKQKYLDAKLTNPLRMAYCTDAWPLSPALFETALANADFHIAQKAFFWDLSPDPSIAPIDDRGQKIGEDVKTLRAILLSQAIHSGFGIFNVSGFVPWNYKYTTVADKETKMEPVASEWTMIDLLSSYGGQTEADANAGVGDVSNLSALCHERLNSELKQNNDKGANNALEYDKDTKYITIYMGDYDSGSWTSSCLPMFWDDPRRGEMPLYWPICSGLSSRIPHLFNYIYETATKNDYFVAGDNGTAYLNSTMFEPELRPEGIPDLMAKWEEQNLEYNRRFDLDILGFHINMDSKTLSLDFIPQRVLDSFAKVWPFGVVATKGEGIVDTEYATHPKTGEITPIIGHWDIGGKTPEEMGENLYNALKHLERRQFHMIRIIMVPPSRVYDAISYAKEKHPDFKFELVDPYTIMRLAKERKKG